MYFLQHRPSRQVTYIMDDESFVGALKCNDKCNIDGVEDTKLAAQETRSRDARKLSTAVGFCLLFMFIEIAGGIKANSLAILTDAAHLLSDIAGFAISIFSIWASGWEANPRQTFGYYRAEILGALLSIQIIWLVTGVLVYEAIVRFIHPDTNINGKIMFIIACIGLGMNIILMITLGHHGHNHSHGGHSHSHDHGHDHNGHDHSSVGHAHNHEHEDHHKHDKAHGHHKEKPSICKRLTNMFGTISIQTPLQMKHLYFVWISRISQIWAEHLLQNKVKIEDSLHKLWVFILFYFLRYNYS